MYSRDSGGDSAGDEGNRDGGELTFEEQYNDIALSCFRYLGFTSFRQVDELTIPEYKLLMKGVALRKVDEEYHLHLQAFLNYAVRSTRGRKNPKPAYPTFEKFYDYEKEQKAVLEGKPPATGPDRFSALKAHLREEGKTNA